MDVCGNLSRDTEPEDELHVSRPLLEAHSLS